LREIFTLLCLGSKSTCHLVVSASVGRNDGDDIDDEEEKKVVNVWIMEYPLVERTPSISFLSTKGGKLTVTITMEFWILTSRCTVL
jgi:hypothetical protein